MILFLFSNAARRSRGNASSIYFFRTSDTTNSFSQNVDNTLCLLSVYLAKTKAFYPFNYTTIEITNSTFLQNYLP